MDIFYYIVISVVTASFIIFLNVILKKMTPKSATKIFWFIVSAILAICVIIFIVSLQIGGWTGMGYGLLTIFILLGVFLASIILFFMQVFYNKS